MLERDAGGGRSRNGDRVRKMGIKTGRAGDREIAGRGSMKPPNLSLRGKDIKLDHSATTNHGKKQLLEKLNGPSCVWACRIAFSRN